MVRDFKKFPSDRIAAAARAMIEGAMADRDAGRPSKTIFAANATRRHDLEEITREVALERNVGVVMIRLGVRTMRADAAFTSGGERIVLSGLAVWLGDLGRAILVPTEPTSDFHVAVGPHGLELRAGRPAGPLGAGARRAVERLQELARLLRDDELGPSLRIVA